MAIRYAQSAPKQSQFTSPKPALKPKHAGGRPKKAAPKIAVSIRIDPQVLAKFKATGKGWQSRMNEWLKAYVP